MAEGRSRVYSVNIKQRSIPEYGSGYSKTRSVAEHSPCGVQSMTMGRSVEPAMGMLFRAATNVDETTAGPTTGTWMMTWAAVRGFSNTITGVMLH